MAGKSGKFILSIGDEGGILTYVQGKAVTRRYFAPSPSYSDTRAFVEAMQADPKAPISMLVDVMDQSYIQQSLPPVSSLSINNLIKRKMERDFAADDLKGALQIGREKEGRRDWKYLFVTLSKTPQLQSWLDLVTELPNQFEGIYLLPVEAENFIHRLRDGIKGVSGKKKKTALDEGEPKWQLLVAHNKVGGFRQVVLKNGKLMFARLAQPIGDNQPEVIAGNIEQEISVTIEYLKRLGYSEDQGINVYVIASEYIKAAIDSTNINATSAHILSPHEAALAIGLDQATEAGDQFADILLAAAFATARKRLLKLETKTQEQLNKLYAGILAVKAGGAAITIGAVVSAIYFGILIPAASSDISDYEQQIRRAESELEKVKEQEKNLPDNLEKITDLVAMHQLLNQLGFTPMEVLKSIEQVDTPENRVYLQELKWEVSDTILTQRGEAQGGRRGNDTAQEQVEKLSMTLGFDMYGTEVGSKEFNTKIDAFTAELKEAFSGFEVKMSSERPGNIDRRTDFALGQERLDPILEKPFYTVNYEINGDGKVEDDKDDNRQEGEL